MPRKGLALICCCKVCKIFSIFSLFFYILLNIQRNIISILQLFLPHYLDSEFKSLMFPSFEEFYRTLFDNELMAAKLVVDSNRNMFEKDAEDLQIAQQHLEINSPMEYGWVEICPETERERLEFVEENGLRND